MATLTEVRGRRRRQLVAAEGTVRERLMADRRGHWVRLTEECSAALQRMGGPAVVGVTSCERGAGRSTIAVALALAQTYRSTKTILLESDLERPSLARMLGLPPGPGVAEVLRYEADLEQSIQVADERLGVITAGDVGQQGPDLLSELIWRDLVEDLSGICGALIVDLPPFVDFGVPLARACPAVLAVVRAGSTSLEAVERLGSELRHASVIVNRADEKLPRWLRTMLRPQP